MSKWTYSGDVNWNDYGGKWFRHTTGKQYQVIEFTNMNEACERDNDGHDPYVVELSLVDLDVISTEQQKSALRSCGPGDDTEITEPWIALLCYEYGCRAPLESWSGGNAHKMLRAARALAHLLAKDSRELAERMDRPVNAIGSTAAEYMTGDMLSGILRGVAEGDPKAELMLKIGVR